MSCNIADIAGQFAIAGRFLDAEAYGSGHINTTYVSRVQSGQAIVRYVHQRINHEIFKSPEQVMENIERVTAHIRAKLVAAGADPARRVMTVVPTVDGKSLYKTPEGEYWRTYTFVEGARTYDVIENPRHVYEAAKAFANFQQAVADLPAPRLHETIAQFGNAEMRFEALVDAVERDPANRAAGVKNEIEFAMARRELASMFEDLRRAGAIPERIIHYDTKINNVMIDDETGEGICVIDLDTVMPGVAMYDFGDAVRTGAATAAEDEPELSKVAVNLDTYDRLCCGYLETAREFLTPTEIDHLAPAARLIMFTQGVRFLSDYVAGDVYYKIARPDHNLDRCRTQFHMVADMESKAEQMERTVAQYR